MRIMILLFAVLVTKAVIASEQPSVDDLSDAIQDEIPAYWNVDDLKVTATANRGDEVEPLIAQRFEATITPSVDLYALHSTKSNLLKPFNGIVPTISTAEKRTLYGVTNSELRAGRWNINVTLENTPDEWGKPQSMYKMPTFVVGSDEESKLLQRYKTYAQSSLEKEITTQLKQLRLDHEKQKRRIENEHAQTLTKLRREHSEEIAATKDAHANLVQRIDTEHQERVKKLRQEIRENEQLLETRLEEIRQAHKVKLGTRKQQLKQTEEAIQLLGALTQKQEELLEREKAALAAEQARVEELLRSFREAWSVEDESKRLAAFKQAIKNPREVIQVAAMEAGLDDASEVVRRAILSSAVASDSLAIRRHALVSILTHDKRIGYRYQATNYDTDVKGASVLVIDSFSAGSVKGKRAADMGKTREIIAFSVTGSGLKWTDEKCAGSLNLQASGELRGLLQCGNYQFTLHGSIL